MSSSHPASLRAPASGPSPELPVAGPPTAAPAVTLARRHRIPQFAIVMAGLIAAAALPQSALFTLDRVDVQGATVLTSHEVITAAGLRLGERLFSIDATRTAKRLEAHSRIKAATVRVKPPRAALITIIERHPLFALTVGEHALLVDDELMVVATAPASAGQVRLPEVIDRGLVGAASLVRPGNVVLSSGARAAVVGLAQLPSWLRAEVVRIIVDAGSDLTLVTRAGLHIRAGTPAGLADRLAQLPQVLEALRGRGVRVVTIDLRYAGSIVVMPATGGDGR